MRIIVTCSLALILSIAQSVKAGESSVPISFAQFSGLSDPPLRWVAVGTETSRRIRLEDRHRFYECLRSFRSAEYNLNIQNGSPEFIRNVKGGPRVGAGFKYQPQSYPGRKDPSLLGLFFGKQREEQSQFVLGFKDGDEGSIVVVHFLYGDRSGSHLELTPSKQAYAASKIAHSLLAELKSHVETNY